MLKKIWKLLMKELILFTETLLIYNIEDNTYILNLKTILHEQCMMPITGYMPIIGQKLKIYY